MTSPFSRDHFTKSLNALAEPAKRFHLWNSQFIPDLMLYHLALDVLEQGRAVGLLVDGGVGRPAYANARSAFEAALDMLVLIARPDQYCEMGARARAWELIDLERLGARTRKADVALEQNREAVADSADAIIEADATVWDGYSPGRGQLLRDASVAIRKNRPGAHWSGMTKAAIAELVSKLTDDPVGVKEMVDALYGLQSVHTHPGSRTHLRDITTKADGTLFVEPKDFDLQGPLGFCAMAADLALIALTNRPVPAESA